MFKYYYYFYLLFFIKHFSFKKFFNLLVGVISFLLKKEIVPSWPFIASIDPANICPLRCPLCPTGRRDKGVKKKMLEFAEFKKYFDQIKDYLFVVRLYNWGEPFLAKDIFKMINYAHKNNVGVVVNSNLNVIPRGLAEKIVKSRLDYLMISIDGISQRSYEKYRQRGDLDKVFKTVKEIVHLKKKYKSKFPVLHWSYLVHKYNFQDIDKAKKMARKMGFDLITFLPLSMVTKVNEPFLESNKEKWLGEKLLSQKGETAPSSACYFLWSSINIGPNGYAFPCCGIYEDKYRFGDLNRKSLAEIWNNEKFKSARLLFKQEVDKEKTLTICQQCTWFKKRAS